MQSTTFSTTSGCCLQVPSAWGCWTPLGRCGWAAAALAACSFQGISQGVRHIPEDVDLDLDFIAAQSSYKHVCMMWQFGLTPLTALLAEKQMGLKTRSAKLLAASFGVHTGRPQSKWLLESRTRLAHPCTWSSAIQPKETTP